MNGVIDTIEYVFDVMAGIITYGFYTFYVGLLITGVLGIF